MMWICNLIGHKMVTSLFTASWLADVVTERRLERPICKRCCLTIEEIIKRQK